MKFLILLPLLTFSLFTQEDLARPVMTAEKIAEINSVQTLWTASENWLTRLSLKEFLHYFKDSHPTSPNLRRSKPSNVNLKQIPTSFDASVQWPNCVVPVYQQGSCAAGYAFAIAAALSERLCISNQTLYTGMNFSAQYFLTCNAMGLKCSGGLIYDAWEGFTTTGTGVITCQPWVGSGTCSNLCVNGTPVTMYYVDSSSIIDLGTSALIQQEIVTNGAITGSMTVYQDFTSYSSGIYSPQSLAIVGTQVVKIFGWGTQAGTNYWICANSWGTSWGMQGLFWIKFGVASIDKLGVAGNIAI